MYVYIYIYIARARRWGPGRCAVSTVEEGLPRLLPVLLDSVDRCAANTAYLLTKILVFRGFDSSRILISRDGIPMSMGNFLEILSQRILVGIILVGIERNIPTFVFNDTYRGF